MSKRQEYVFDVIRELSDKYDTDLMDLKIHLIEEKVSEEDWKRLHNAIKYGEETH
ncbi:MAG: hypothetical protein L7S72_09530 [Flavobacteriales bacterium]|nr:hypothetical protein [Flavobacteriales bacterium]